MIARSPPTCDHRTPADAAAFVEREERERRLRRGREALAWLADIAALLGGEQ